MKLTETMGNSRERWWLVLFVGVGLALRALAIAGFQHSPESDELAYRSMALNLVSGNGIIDHQGNRAMFSVGYPLFVLAPVFYVFGDALLAARVFNLALGGAAIALCYLVAAESGAGRLGRLMAAALWALYLPASVYGVYLYKENLMIPLMLGVMWCALRLAQAPSIRIAAGCGALFGLLALTGNAALSLVGVVPVALLFARASMRRRVAFAGIMFAAAVAIASPWIVRNMQVIGAPVLNTNGGFNLYLGNNPAATGMFVSISDTPRGPTWEALRAAGEVQASETLKREAISWIKENPLEFLRLTLKRGASFWTPPFHEGKGNATPAEVVVRVLWAMQFVVVLGAAIAGLMLASLRNRKLAILWLAVGCYTVVHMIFYVIYRYREPIMPLLCVMAALALEALYLRAASWRRREAA